MTSSKLRVEQIRSCVSRVPKHRLTLRALGLGRIGKSSILTNNPAVQGMIKQVDYMVKVTPVEGS